MRYFYYISKINCGQTDSRIYFLDAKFRVDLLPYDFPYVDSSNPV